MLKTNEWTANHILNLVSLYKVSELLFTVVHFDLFTRLETCLTVEELASELSLDQESLEVVLRVLVYLDLLDYHEGKYSVKSSAKMYLSRNSETSLADLFELERVMRNKSNLNESLIVRLKGEKKIEPLEFPDTEIYMNAMTAGGKYSAILLSRYISRYFSKDAKGSALDLGCGSGIFAKAIGRMLPNFTFTLMDRKEVLEAARKNFEGSNDVARFSFIPKDFVKEELDGKYDLILLSNILHLYPRSICEDMLNKVARLLKDRGYVVIHDFFVHQDFLQTALFSLDWLANHAVRFDCTLEEASEWLHLNGWRVVESRHLPNLPTSYLVIGK